MVIAKSKCRVRVVVPAIAMRLDPMLNAAQWPQVVHPSLARRATACRRQVRNGVIKIHPPTPGRVRETAGRHPQEHRFTDPPRNLISRPPAGVSSGSMIGCTRTSHVVSPRNRRTWPRVTGPSPSRRPTPPPIRREIRGASEQSLVAEMDMQHHLGPQFPLIDSGRPDDQRRTGRLRRRLGL